ncbi:type VII secretion protein EccC [Virgisporangium aliadipatigenens]|uniref:Type VII secretion protein EccC n=1 Tax=Virgisporangium aliadipatigenens TaxID=741659 RepID=A0A8J3YPH2_9ACTN|nr:type VII secretion protein EccCa [Virgisporangium aliadipatigenens]GIJ49006.1 type VII secretion protein EccC [Virgisporangium aliadipatigenens]
MTTVLYRRPPRRPAPPMPRGDLQVDPPPELPEPVPRGFGPLLMMLPMVAGVAAMAILYSGRGGGTLTYVVGGLFGLSMLGMAGASFGSGHGNKRGEVDAQRREYMRYLAQLRRQVRTAAERQRAALMWRHPAPAVLWSVCASMRLWERRSTDDDFGEVRVAQGPQKLAVSIVPPQTRPVEDLEPLTAMALRRFVKVHSVVPDLPLAVQLRAFSRVVLRGERAPVLDLARSMLCQLAALHSPDDLRIAVIADGARFADWDWAKWLPHAQDDRRIDAAGAGRQVWPDADAVEEAFAETLAGRPRHTPEARPLPGQPHLVVVVDGGEVPAASTFHGVAPLGVTVLDLSGVVPRDAGRWLICLDVGAETLAADRGDRSTPLGRPDRLSEQQAAGLARQLAPYRLSRVAEAGEEATARIMELPELLGLGDAGAVDTHVTWRERPDRDRLRIPLGVAPDGGTVELDLKEAAQDGMGPHGLVIGATGSGKSELLRTIVSSLAVTHSSQELNFVLVDFKGGATFASLDALPHTSAVITNLAEELSMVDRMQDAVAGEMTRRQELLRAAGNYVSRYEYERARRAGAELDPLPSLLIICDEFSELLAVKPDFIDLFVQIGRLGRSLGVHLLLASQRLEEGRLRGLDTHLSYRIGLRTFSAMESRVVLGVPDAYDLPSAPGHGYLKVGNVAMQRFRAAYVSGPYRPAAIVGRRAQAVVRRRIVPYGLTHIPVPPEVATEPEPDEVETDTVPGGRRITMLDMLIDRLRGHGPAAHQVWLPPLGVADGLEPLLGELVTDPERGLHAPRWGLLRAPLGIVDRPYEQRRDPLLVDLGGAAGNVVVVGAPRSGKSTLLRTMIASLALTHTPREVQFFCLDLGGGSLRALDGLPHVSGVAVRRDVEAVRRTVAEVRVLLAEREALFVERGIESIDAYRERRRRGEFAEDPFGDVFLVVDGYGALREEFEELDDIVVRLAGQCLGFGVHLMLTANRWGELRHSLRDLLTSRFELRLGDPGDSEVDRRAAGNVPVNAPGRGVTQEKLQFLAAVPRIDGHSGAGDLSAGTAELVRRVAESWKHAPAPKVRLLPRLLPASALPSDGVAIGLNETYLAPVYLRFDTEPHLIAVGDAASGKTNLLRLIARSIVDGRAGAAKLAVVDYRRTLLGVVPREHLLDYATTARAAERMAGGIAQALNERLPGPDVTTEQLRNRSWWSGSELFLIVDDYDIVANPGSNPLSPLLELLPQSRDIGLHIVVTRRAGGAGRGLYETLLQRMVELETPGLILSGNRDEGALFGGVRPGQQPPGRGVLVRRSDGTNLIQTAWTEPEA